MKKKKLCLVVHEFPYNFANMWCRDVGGGEGAVREGEAIQYFKYLQIHVLYTHERKFDYFHNLVYVSLRP